MFQMKKAAMSDAKMIVDLVQSVYRGEASKQGWTTEAHVLDGQRVDSEMVKEIIANSDSTILLYMEHDKLLGSVQLDMQSGRAHLGMLSVSLQMQGHKLGQKILHFAEQFSKKEWAVSEIVIEVLDGRDELMAWYERRGFHKTGRTMPFPDNPRYGIPKKKNLFFHEMVKKI